MKGIKILPYHKWLNKNRKALKRGFRECKLQKATKKKFIPWTSELYHCYQDGERIIQTLEAQAAA